MSAFLLTAILALAVIPMASNAASRYRPPKRSQRRSRTRHRTATRSRRHRARGPAVQMHPTVARYKQIQQALADRGYYHGDIDGKWGPDSTAALRKFQTEQGIENEGKITALALIGLGLGPKHTHLIVPSEPTDKKDEPADARDDHPPKESPPLLPG
jgi:hypothetical protein